MGDKQPVKQAEKGKGKSTNVGVFATSRLPESCGSPTDINTLSTPKPTGTGVKTSQLDKKTKKSSKTEVLTNSKSSKADSEDSNRREAHEVSTTTLLEAQKSSFNELTQGITAGFNDMTNLLRALVEKDDKQGTRKRKHGAITAGQSDDGSSNDDDRHGHKSARLSEISPSEDELDNSIDDLIHKESSASENQEKEGTSFLEQIEQDYELEEAPGAAVDEKLAAIINKMARNKMTEEKLKDKMKTYPTPSNCEALVAARKVNKEIWSKLRPGTRGRDLKFQQIQSTLVKAVNPLVMLTDKALANQGKAKLAENNEELIKMLTNAIALILHSNAELSQRRLDLIRPDLNKQYQQICSEVTENSTYLFGDDLAQKIKDINATNRVGQKLSDTSYRGKSNRSSSYGHSRSSQYSKNWSKPQGRGHKGYRPSSASQSSHSAYKGKQTSQQSQAQ